MQLTLEESFALKTKIMGRSPEFYKELKIFNRRISWHDEGIKYEADEKHAMQVLKDLNMEHCKVAGTPGDKEVGVDEALGLKCPISLERATKFRSIAARCNYLSADRPDIQYATKEVARGMANPTEGDWQRMKRLAKYLAGVPRVEQWFFWQERPATILCFTDSDWARWKESRKSTSGGGIRIGSHLIKTWSRTQATIATSSGEAEFYAAVKGAAELLGVQSLAKDMGVEFGAQLRVDAKAAIGMVHRLGLGKIRHVEVGHLWIQDAGKQCRIEVKKVLGTENIADVFTKHVEAGLRQRHLDKMPLRVR